MRRFFVALTTLAISGAPALAQTFGSPTHFTEQGGAAIYAAVCADCHMRDGRGAEGAGRYPSLEHNVRLAVPGYAISIVLRGQKDMPAFGHSLTDGQIADVVTYIETHFGNADDDAPNPADVKAARPTDPPPP